MRIRFSHLSPVQLFAVTLDLLVPARFDLISNTSGKCLSYYVTQLNTTGI